MLKLNKQQQALIETAKVVPYGVETLFQHALVNHDLTLIDYIIGNDELMTEEHFVDPAVAKAVGRTAAAVFGEADIETQQAALEYAEATLDAAGAADSPTLH
jgi:hypothetical protein